MKAFLLLFVGLIAVQSASLRIAPVPLPYSPIQAEDDELFVNEIGQGLNQFGSVIFNGMRYAVDGTGHLVGEGIHAVGEGVNKVGHVFAQSGKMINGVVHYSYHELALAAQKQYSRAEAAVKNTVASALAFREAIEAWKSVDWKTGRNMMFAIQVTSRDCRNFYVALNKLTGGKLNDSALRYAELLAIEVFPPSAIFIETGKVVYKVSGQVKDITQIVHDIDVDIHTGNWAHLAVDAFKLFKIIYDDLK